MAIRVLYVPFALPVSDFAPGAEYQHKNSQWKELYRGSDEVYGEHEVYDLVYNPNGGADVTMWNLSALDQVYIRGHSKPGFDGIFSANTNERGEKLYRHQMNQDLQLLIPDKTRVFFSLGAEEVVQRLVQSGLRPTFAGDVKCYNCYSADGNPNFATAVSQALAARGFNVCHVFGYHQKLPSFHSEVGGHKLQKDGGRASDRRVQIR